MILDKVNMPCDLKALSVAEMKELATEMRELIIKRASSAEIKDLAIKQGMHTLREEGIDKILEGTTSVEEVLRVLV